MDVDSLTPEDLKEVLRHSELTEDILKIKELYDLLTLEEKVICKKMIRLEDLF